MPVLLKEYTFEQQSDKIFLSIPCPNIVASKTSLDLYDSINTDKSTCSVGDGKVLFELVKLQSSDWPTAAYKGEDRLERRQKASERDLEFQAKKREERLSNKRAQEKELIKKQMLVEENARKEIEALKQRELEMAQAQIHLWAARLESKNDADSEPESSDSDIDEESIRKSIRAQIGVNVAPIRSAITQKVSVEFTSRGAIPTSTARETEDAKWMARIKLIRALKNHKPEDTPTGAQVKVLKLKAQDFSKFGDYQGACNILSQCLELDPVDVSLTVERAAVYFQLGDGNKCVSDCDTGLEMVDREIEIIEKELKQDDGQSETRLQLKSSLLAQRGKAKAKLLNDITGAIRDYETAMEFKSNDDIINELENLKKLK